MSDLKLETLLEEFREAVRSGDVTRLTPLSKVLVEGLE